MGDCPEPAAPARYAPFEEKFSAGSWHDKPLREFLQNR
jgi:hypothetical protein